MADKNDFVFLPLGGVGEIGMNMALYGYGTPKKRKWIIVDFGVTFPDEDLPGVDLVFADIKFIEDNRDDIEAIVITHAHEDHYGALLSLWDRVKKPVWCTPFTAAMIGAKKQGERGWTPDIRIKEFRPGDRFNLGPFEIEAVHVTHSIPEPVSLAITTPLGTALHTGDWKLDPEPTLGNRTDADRFQELGDAGILALVCDSTNAMREGTSPSEEEISEGIAGVIANAEGRVAITSFSSNVGRIRSVAQAAQKTGRRVVLLGRSLKRVVEVSDELGYMDGLEPFLTEDEFSDFPRNKVVMILTGTQGEPRAALAKLSRDDHPRVHLTAGDTVVFSSRAIPGNEKGILEIQNRLIDNGVNIITDQDAPVHVSGHPRRNELMKMYGWTKPKIAVPVHGEAAHLVAHAKLAKDMGVDDVMGIRNGDMLRLAPGQPQVIADVKVDRIFKDGNVIGDEEAVGVEERRSLSFAGQVSIGIAIESDGSVVGDIEVEALGLPFETWKGEDFEDICFEAATSAVNSIPQRKRRDAEVVRQAVSRAVRAAVRNAWGKKPITTVLVMQV
ncbi:MAG: ribonuclease J [Pseudomonadota bacterium]